MGEHRVPAGQQQTATVTEDQSETLNESWQRWRDSLEAGLAVKYLIMKRCRDGTLQQQNTMALAAMIPGKKGIQSSNPHVKVQRFARKH